MHHYSLEPANFSDYRDFLRHRFEALKAKSTAFSLQNCAKRSRISKSLLQFLFRKQRHISLDKLPSLAKTLKLTSEEEYFTYLMLCRNSSQNPAIQSHFEQILNRIRHEHVKTAEKEPPRSDESKKTLHQNHLYMILQTLVRLVGFKEDSAWILKNLFLRNLTEEKVQAVLTDLERLGFLYRDENSQLKSKPDTLWRPDPYDPDGQGVFQMAAESVAELMKNPEAYKPSVYMSMSLSMDEEHLLAAERFMIDVHHRLCAMAAESKNPTAAVYIGNFLMTVARLKSQEAPNF